MIEMCHLLSLIFVFVLKSEDRWTTNRILKNKFYSFRTQELKNSILNLILITHI